MHAGELVADRFEIVRLAGTGGMGAVYQATDRLGGHSVALKVLQAEGDTDAERFAREAKLLARLEHPAIVQYVDHGITATGARFMAMEWLEGEDLSQRFKSRGLSIDESLALIKRVAGALSAAHDQGIIHRDIKPSNLFLVAGEPSRVKVLDFGIARPTLASQAMTRTGALVGTLSYMSPEQARGDRALDSRLDVFALGTVLYECLTGEQAFAGTQAVGVLAKILFNEIPRVRDVRPDMPRTLDGLVARMMAKDPGQRPANGAAVIAALDALGSLDELGPAPAARAGAPALTGGEKRLLSVMLVSREGDPNTAHQETLTPAQLSSTLDPLRSVVGALGAEVAPLADGAVLVKLEGRGTAMDQAAQAAACALAIQSAVPGYRVALATGPADVSGQWPVGRVIDRAAALLEVTLSDSTGGVHIDEVTAGLLDARFDVDGTQTGRILRGNRAVTGARPLLGKPTPCVGRARELGMLDLLYAECIDEPMAGAALVSGAVGVGKSRVGYEFVGRVKERGEARILTARGDPVYAGSAFGVVSQLVRRAAGLHEGDAPESQYARLKEYLSGLFDGQAHTHTAEFLGVLVQVPTADDPSPQLVAARNDARIMSEQLRAAFVGWLGALCADKPLLLVLEDLQWGDLSSITFLGSALRHHAEEPLMILALARPEVHEEFPRLWSDAGLQEIGLGPLKPRAAQKLAKAVLGKDVDADTVERIVTRAGGNAFYLEELIRHVAEGDDRDFPETVLAMAQSRLEGLEPDARLTLRIASIFGEVFWESAAATLLGNRVNTSDTASWLDTLVKREILERSQADRFPGERELVFRHDLHRQAAYAMLTGKDRTLGHRLAGEWLESKGEPDALVLAEHFYLGERPERSIPYFLRAAQGAVAGANLEAAIAIADRGINCGADGEDRGSLLLVQAQAHLWTDDLMALASKSAEALPVLTQGSPPWLFALAGLSHAAAYGGNPMALMTALGEIQGYAGKLPAIGPTGAAVATLINSLHHMGQRDQAAQLYERLDTAQGEVEDPVFVGWHNTSRSVLALYAPRIAEAVEAAEAAVVAFEDARDELAVAMSMMVLGSVRLEAGQLGRCEEVSRVALARAQRLKIGFVEGYATIFVGLSRILQGHHDEGLALLEPLLGSEDLLLAAIARMEMAYGYLLAGQPGRAREEAQMTVDATGFLPLIHGSSHAVLAAATLAEGHAAESLDLTEVPAGLGDQACLVPMYDKLLRLTKIRALDALGRSEEATALLRTTWQDLQTQAAPLSPTDRERFLTGLPVHAEIRSLVEHRSDGR